MLHQLSHSDTDHARKDIQKVGCSLCPTYTQFFFISVPAGIKIGWTHVSAIIPPFLLQQFSIFPIIERKKCRFNQSSVLKLPESVAERLHTWNHENVSVAAKEHINWMPSLQTHWFYSYLFPGKSHIPNTSHNKDEWGPENKYVQVFFLWQQFVTRKNFDQQSDSRSIWHWEIVCKYFYVCFYK